MLTEGDNIICTATGYPAPDIVWQNSDGSNSSRFITRSLINKISTVNITLTVRKSDVGVYKCIAHNSAGESVHTINITVQGKLFSMFLCWNDIVHLYSGGKY